MAIQMVLEIPLRILLCTYTLLASTEFDITTLHWLLARRRRSAIFRLRHVLSMKNAMSRSFAEFLSSLVVSSWPGRAGGTTGYDEGILKLPPGLDTGLSTCKHVFTRVASAGAYQQPQLLSKADDLAVCILRASVAIAWLRGAKDSFPPVVNLIAPGSCSVFASSLFISRETGTRSGALSAPGARTQAVTSAGEALSGRE